MREYLLEECCLSLQYSLRELKNGQCSCFIYFLWNNTFCNFPHNCRWLLWHTGIDNDVTKLPLGTVLFFPGCSMRVLTDVWLGCTLLGAQFLLPRCVHRACMFMYTDVACHSKDMHLGWVVSLVVCEWVFVQLCPGIGSSLPTTLCRTNGTRNGWVEFLQKTGNSWFLVNISGKNQRKQYLHIIVFIS